jgi:ATP-dependent protease ClpP protease subunit
MAEEMDGPEASLVLVDPDRTEALLAALPMPELAQVNALGVDLASRELSLTGMIEEDTGHWFVGVLRYLERHAPGEPVRVLLSTPGGDEAAMFAIHDAIRATSCPVEVLAYGEVCSAGVLLLACGDTRYVLESTALMSHESQGSDEAPGYRASRDRMKYREWQHRYWADLMGRYTPKDARWWLRVTERQAEYWLMGGQAIVEAGLADEVVRTWPAPRSIAARKRTAPFYTHVSGEEA